MCVNNCSIVLVGNQSVIAVWSRDGGGVRVECGGDFCVSGPVW